MNRCHWNVYQNCFDRILTFCNCEIIPFGIIKSPTWNSSLFVRWLRKPLKVGGPFSLNPEASPSIRCRPVSMSTAENICACWYTALLELWEVWLNCYGGPCWQDRQMLIRPLDSPHNENLFDLDFITPVHHYTTTTKLMFYWIKKLVTQWPLPLRSDVLIKVGVLTNFDCHRYADQYNNIIYYYTVYWADSGLSDLYLMFL